MTFNPWFAYDCMVVAFNEQRWQSAYDIATALIATAKVPGLGSARWFKGESAAKWFNIVVIEGQCKKHGIDESGGRVIIDPAHRSRNEQREIA